MEAFHKKDFTSIKNNTLTNNVLSEYYEKLALEAEDLKQKNILYNKSDNIKQCSKYWELDIYKQYKVKDIIRLNRCKDRYCLNCKKVKQANSIIKYKDVLQQNNSYHFVVTVPNVLGYQLKDTIKKMAYTFKKLYRYMSYNYVLKDYPLPKAIGCLRSLEVTYKKVDGTYYYHPHYHCIITFDKPLDLQKNKTTKFSFSYGEHKRYFSGEEIYIANLWYKLYNNINNTKKIDNIYSIILDKATDSNIYEVLKYLTKAVDEDNNTIEYEVFKTLYYSLYRVKQLQGYGVYFNIKDNLDDDDDDLIIDNYYKYLAKLTDNSKPIRDLDYLDNIIKDTVYNYYSKYKYLRKIKDLD